MNKPQLPEKLTEQVVNWNKDGTPFITKSLTPAELAINQIITYLKSKEIEERQRQAVKEGLSKIKRMP